MAEIYNIHYPDGSVEENVTLAGKLRQIEQVVERPPGRWVGKWIVADRFLPDEFGAPWNLNVMRPDD